MAQFNYQGQLDAMNSIHFEFISQMLKEKGFEPDTVNVAAVGKLGDNYLSIVKRLTIKDFSFIAKIASTTPIIREKMKTAKVFLNETLVYDIMLPKFEEYQKFIGIERPLRYAECYGILKDENEIILLEDLNAAGYNILNRLEPLTDECIRLVLKDFALLHSLSFVMKKRDPEIFNHLSSQLTSLWDTFDDMFKAGMTMVEDQLMKVLDNEEFKEKVKGLILTALPLYPEYEKRDSDAGKGVLIQGDAWTNNLLFKIENDKPTECIMIDYQQTRQSNLLTDINYLIFNCSDYETRSKNFHNWINFYYKEFTKNLAAFNMDSDEVYPRENLDSDLRVYAKLSLATGLIFNTFILRESEEVFDFQKEMENNKDIQVDELLEKANAMTLAERTKLRLKDRVTGLIQSFVDLGLI